MRIRREREYVLMNQRVTLRLAFLDLSVPYTYKTYVMNVYCRIQRVPKIPTTYLVMMLLPHHG